MIIHYSPSYDGEIYVGCGARLMGVSYVGTMGLLRLLQLRAGIHRETKSAIEREADYMCALKQCVAGTLFNNAFTVDEIGVAGKLLQWRDSLLMAGWNGECADDSLPKLAVLANVEKNFKSCGVVDCWVEVCRVYGERGILDDTIKEIVVECPFSEIPLLVKRTLDAIAGFGTKVIQAVKGDEDVQPLDKEKVKVLEFEELTDAYEWIAQVESLPEDTVVINRDNVLLNHILYTWDRPQVHSSAGRSNPQLLQLFKLGMSIFSRPLNIANLVSYLQMPMNPIPDALRYKLAKMLIDNGGFGERKIREDGEERDEWENIIDSFEFLNNDGKPTAQARSAKMQFLAPVRKEYDGGIGKVELLEYLDAMLKWIGGKFSDQQLPDEVHSQLCELQVMCAALKKTIDAAGTDAIPFADVQKMVLQIYRPMDCALQTARNGALNVVDSIGRVATPVDTLIWLDCQNEDIENDHYAFLSSRERQFLENAGAVIPDFALHLQQRRREMFAKLSAAKRVFLVRSAYNGTTRLGEHSLIAELRQQSGGKLPLVENAESLFDMVACNVKIGNVESLSSAQYLQLPEIDYSGRVESASSLDTLIQHPFNYVMKYIAKLYEPTNAQVKELRTVLGLVAHSFFEHIIADSRGEMAVMRALVDSEFGPRLESAIDVTGLILRLPENASALNDFRINLKESILSLIAIMEHLALTPVGCEVTLPAEDKELSLEGIGAFGARVDLLLKNKRGEYVVFDLKWSYSKDYAEKLEENTSIQLELYRQAIKVAEGRGVAAIGYYMMPRKQLVTCDYDDLFDPSTNHKLIHCITPADTPLFAQLQNSYRLRIDEIKVGRIEEGEMTDFFAVDGCYYSRQAEKGLYPLKVKLKYDNPRSKSRVVVSAVKESETVYGNSSKSTFDSGDKTPAETPTSFAILKGRLK